MRNQSVFKLNRQALIAAIISAAFPVASHAAAGRVEFAVGNVTASGADGRERSLTKGAEINSGDTIQTVDGRTQIKFTDGGYMSLQPNTQFKVDDYAYDGKTDGSEKGFFKLVKGGLRAITGAIGHTTKTAYRINTPVATIGIRGTELTGEYSEEGDSKKLVVHVSHGSVFLQNGGGDLILFQGQSGAVTDENQQPDYTNDETLVTAQGPNGGSAEDNNEEQQQQQEQSTTFTQAEQVNGDGVPDAVIPIPTVDPNIATLAAMASYAGAQAEGVYTLDTAVAQTGNITNGYYKNITMEAGSKFTVEFQPRSIYAEVSLSAQNVTGGGSISSQHFSGGGSLTTGTGLQFTASGDNGLCSCDIHATGAISGPTAQKAAISYNITDEGGSFTGKNTAGFIAHDVPAKPPE